MYSTKLAASRLHLYHTRAVCTVTINGSCTVALSKLLVIQSIALAAHSACRDRLLVGWDIAVGPDGAVMLEGNSYPDVDFLQRSHQCAIGDSPLGPLLYSRLVDLERRASTGTLRGPLDYE